MPEPNSLLRAARERTPSRRVPCTCMSRDELADAVAHWIVERDDNGRDVAFDANHLGKLERGIVRRPRPLYVAALGAVLGATEAELGFTPSTIATELFPLPSMPGVWTPQAAAELADAIRAGDALPVNMDTATRLVHEWLVVEPPQTVELRAGRRIGLDLANKIVRRVTNLRHLDDYVAGGDLHTAIERELAATSTLVRDASYSDKTGRRLLVAFGELCQIAGWVTADAGMNRRAERYYTVGTTAAHAAGDTPLAGNLISSLAYHVANTGQPRDAVLLAQSALAGSRTTTTPTTRALFLERLAWSHSKAHDADSAARTLGHVEDTYARRNPGDDDPEWVYWLTADEIDVMAGRCWTELQRPAHAIPPLERALATYDDRCTREVALYLSWLAEAYLQAHDVEHAAEIAMRTVETNARTASARSDERVRVLAKRFAPHAGVPAARDLIDAMNTLD